MLRKIPGICRPLFCQGQILAVWILAEFWLNFAVDFFLLFSKEIWPQKLHQKIPLKIHPIICSETSLGFLQKPFLDTLWAQQNPTKFPPNSRQVSQQKKSQQSNQGARNHPEISSQKVADFECRFPCGSYGKNRAPFWPFLGGALHSTFSPQNRTIRFPPPLTLKTLTSLNEESRPFLLGDKAFGVFPLFLALAITAFGGPEGQRAPDFLARTASPSWTSGFVPSAPASYKISPTSFCGVRRDKMLRCF